MRNVRPKKTTAWQWILFGVFAAAAVALAAGLIIHAVGGDSDVYRSYNTEKVNAYTTVPGDITDRNGEVLVSSRLDIHSENEQDFPEAVNYLESKEGKKLYEQALDTYKADEPHIETFASSKMQDEYKNVEDVDWSSVLTDKQLEKYNAAYKAYLEDMPSAEDYMSDTEKEKYKKDLETYFELCAEYSETYSGRFVFSQYTGRATNQKRYVRSSQYIDNTIYSQLIGYMGRTSVDFKRDEEGGFALNEEDEKSITTTSNGYRLMEFLRDQLYPQGESAQEKGNNITLTIDHGLQSAAAQALQKRVDPEDGTGSVVVLDAKTGEILSMVSYPTFDVSETGYKTDVSDIGYDEGKEYFPRIFQNFVSKEQVNTVKELNYPIAQRGNATPGSIFKLVTATALLDSGFEDFQVTDTQTVMIDGREISNQYTADGTTIGYVGALEKSSNVFFSQAGVRIGEEQMSETAKKFMIGSEVKLDFCTLNAEGADTRQSVWKLNSDSTDSEIAVTSFGQGDTRLSTLNAAMIYQSIANGGMMVKPYMIKEITSQDGKTVSTGKTEILSEVTSEETADKLSDALHLTMQGYIGTTDYLTANSKQILDQYAVAGKTGTAETGNLKTDTNNLWLASYAPYDDPQYVVVVNQCGTYDKSARVLLNSVADIYQYLFEEYAAEREQ
ncbi:MAG: hypothetical protein LUE11_07100 [Clostridia bacterium]|nr:hypothetical protein [Clostridia bacterium]